MYSRFLDIYLVAEQGDKYVIDSVFKNSWRNQAEYRQTKRPILQDGEVPEQLTVGEIGDIPVETKGTQNLYQATVQTYLDEKENLDKYYYARILLPISNINKSVCSQAMQRCLEWVDGDNGKIRINCHGSEDAILAMPARLAPIKYDVTNGTKLARFLCESIPVFTDPNNRFTALSESLSELKTVNLACCYAARKAGTGLIEQNEDGSYSPQVGSILSDFVECYRLYNKPQIEVTGIFTTAFDNVVTGYGGFISIPKVSSLGGARNPWPTHIANDHNSAQITVPITDGMKVIDGKLRIKYANIYGVDPDTAVIELTNHSEFTFDLTKWIIVSRVGKVAIVQAQPGWEFEQKGNSIYVKSGERFTHIRDNGDELTYRVSNTFAKCRTFT